MKQLIGFACAALLLAGCAKEEAGAPLASNNETLGVAKAANYRVYFDNGADPGVEGSDYGCSGSGGNCLPDVIVSGIHVSAINNVFAAVYTKNNTTIRTSFTANKSTLYNYVAKAHVDGVVNGTHTARAKGVSPNNRYLSIRTNAGVLVGVYPLK